MHRICRDTAVRDGFEVGVVLEDSQWQAPAHCFPDDEEIEKSKENDYVEEPPADGLEGVRRLVRKFAGAATF